MKKVIFFSLLFFMSSCSLLTNSIASYQKAIIELAKEVICTDPPTAEINVNSKGIADEKFYQNLFCTWFSCQKEVTWSDGSRIDALSSTYAIEVEFSSKWSNSIGQAIHYSLITKHNAGIAIIKTKLSDSKNIDKLLRICNLLKIKVWQIETYSLKITPLN